MCTKNILLSGGRAPAALELARLLSSQGHQVTVIESIPYHVCQHSRFVRKVLFVPSPRTNSEGFISTLIQHIKKEKIDIFIPLFEEIFIAARHHKELSSLCQCWLEPLPRLDSLHNKWTFIKLARGLAEKLPQTLYLTSWKEVESALARQPEMDWVLKPVYSRSSAQVRFISGDSKINPIAISPNRPWVLQEKVVGEQICTYSLAYKGRLLIHSAYTTPYTAGEGTSVLYAPYQNNLLQQRIENWINENNWTGQLSFDWIKNKDGHILPIECNPRMTSGIHLFSDADQIDVAFITPEKVEKVLTPKIPQTKMFVLGMILYGLPSCKNPCQFITWCKMMSTYQDVVFRWSDPLPVYSQLRSLAYFWRLGRRKKITLLEASTEDIEWNGDFI